jgi:hypothetical protein
MGRKLMIVPLDFKYPKNKVWEGYLNPCNGEQCRRCGDGAENIIFDKNNNANYLEKLEATATK